MDDPLDKAFRSLAGTSAGPFRAIAYAARSGKSGEEAALARELGALLKKEDLDLEAIVIVEPGPMKGAALGSPRFKAEVLGRLKAGSRKGARANRPVAPLEGRGAPLRAREQLSALSASLPDLLRKVDQKLAGFPTPESDPLTDSEAAPAEGVPAVEAPASLALPAPPDPRDLGDLAPLLFVRTFEDLGHAAESVAHAVRTVILLGAHVVVYEEGFDTRSREGRALCRMALRLGELRGTRAKEWAVADLKRRRDGLRVYGPIPFGFRREGKELVPVEDQLGTVKRLRELARLEQTPVTIAVTLNREKRLWKDGSLWSWRRVTQVLKNPLYDRVLTETRS